MLASIVDSDCRCCCCCCPCEFRVESAYDVWLASAAAAAAAAAAKLAAGTILNMAPLIARHIKSIRSCLNIVAFFLKNRWGLTWY